MNPIPFLKHSCLAQFRTPSYAQDLITAVYSETKPGMFSPVIYGVCVRESVVCERVSE